MSKVSFHQIFLKAFGILMSLLLNKFSEEGTTVMKIFIHIKFY